MSAVASHLTTTQDVTCWHEVLEMDVGSCNVMVKGDSWLGGYTHTHTHTHTCVNIRMNRQTVFGKDLFHFIQRRTRSGHAIHISRNIAGQISFQLVQETSLNTAIRVIQVLTIT